MWSKLRGLQAQIILWTILPLTLLLIGISFTGIYSHQQSMRTLVKERDENLALVYASLISDELSRHQLALQGLSTQEAFRHLDISVLQDVLAGDTTAYKMFQGRLALLDTQGNALANTEWTMDWRSRQMLQELAERITASGQPAFSPVVEMGGKESFLLGVPATYDQTTGVLAGAVGVDDLELERILAQVQVGKRGAIYLTDSEGRIIYHPDASQLGRDSDSTFQSGRDDQELAIAYATVPQTGWQVVVQEPWEDVMAPVLRYSQLTPLIIAAATLMSLLATAFGLRYIIRPLQALGQQARRLAWGDFSATETPVGGVGEIEDLRLTLDQMADQLQEYRTSIRDYLAFLTRGQEEERHRLARELHDDTTQSLIALAQRIEMVQKALARDPDLAGARLAELKEMVTGILQDIRRFTHDLRPTYLEDLGFLPALQMLVRELDQRDDLKATFEASGAIRRLPLDLELTAFRIAQEGLNNAARHAQASNVRLAVQFADEGLTIHVEDDGVGFTAPERPWELARGGHFGLMGMQERARMSGGHLSIESSPGSGANVTAFLPYR
jgi:signal transduction histidine kinase